jgi:hypothetical protein
MFSMQAVYNRGMKYLDNLGSRYDWRAAGTTTRFYYAKI